MKRKALAFILLILIAGCAPEPTQPSQLTKPTKQYSFKKFPVLEYHLIQRPEARWSRTPENFRKDIAWLYENGYYPMNVKDILTSLEGVPEGKTPVILTFDDSSSGQFRYLKDGTLDPDSAVGILKSFHDKHPNEWPMRGTFFIVVQTNNPDRNVFGQPEYIAKKMAQLKEWGMEVASHCYSHERLSDISYEEAQYALARSYKALKQLSSQEIVSIALPMGLYPEDETVFSKGYQKIPYCFKLAAEVAGGMQPAPWEKGFDPLHIKRIQAIDSEWRKFFPGRKI